jgi:uncharacterized membrane protein
MGPQGVAVRSSASPGRVVAARSEKHHGTFGHDAFGRGAERAARFFGTPEYIFGQTVVVIAWIALNAVAFSLRWDPYPFILLNLAFSTQAAYAAPLILLAPTRLSVTRSPRTRRRTCTPKPSSAIRSASRR